MRIIFDIRPLAENFLTGVSIYTRELLYNVLSIDKENKYLLFYNSASRNVRLPKFLEKFDNWELKRFRFSNKIFNLGLKLEIIQIDSLVGGADLMFMPNINFVSLTRRCKLVITAHDLSFLLPGFYGKKEILWHKLVNPKKLFSLADRVISVSVNTSKDLIRAYGLPGSKIQIIYSGFNKDIYSSSRGSSYKKEERKDIIHWPQKFILFLGNVEDRKNIRSLLEVWQKIKSRYQEYSLVIAGRPVLKLEKDFPSVIFLGYVNEEQKADLYRRASVFVYISHYEGFGLPVLEAMASGCPVITSFSSSLPEVTREAAIYIDPNNLNELIFALDNLLRDSQLRDRMSKRGLLISREFSWRETARKTVELFSKFR